MLYNNILNTSPLWDMHFAVILSQSVSWESHYILTNKDFLIQNPWKCKPAHRVYWCLQGSGLPVGGWGRGKHIAPEFTLKRSCSLLWSPISWFSCILLISIIFSPMLLAFCSCCNFRQKCTWKIHLFLSCCKWTPQLPHFMVSPK